jgi:hypothetical protein
MRLHGRTAPARGLVKLLLVSTAIATAASAARAQVYLHSTEEEKAANQVKDGIDAAKKSHLEALDTHKTTLEAAIARERQLIAERELASRDMMMAEILENHDDSAATDKGDDPKAELGQEIHLRLATIAGLVPEKVKATLIDRVPARLQLYAHGVSDGRSEADAAVRARDISIKSFEAAGGKAQEGKYCDISGEPKPVNATPNVGRDQFAAVVYFCGKLKQLRAAEKALTAGLPPEARAILGIRESTDPPLRGEMGLAVAERDNLRDLVKAQNGLMKAAKQQLEELEKFHRCEVKRSGNVPSQEAKDAAIALEKFHEWLSGLDAETLEDELPAQAAPAADSGGPAAKKEGGAAATCKVTKNGKTDTVQKPEKVASTQDLADRAGLKLDLKTAVRKAAAFDPTRSLLASLQQGAEEYKATKLSEVVSAFAHPGDDEQGEKGEGAAAALGIVDNAWKLHQVRSGKLPDTSGVLVRLAGARMKAATAQAEAQRLKKLSDLADLRVAALREEAVGLVDAGKLLGSGTTSGFERALMRYSDSWGRGRMPGMVIEADIRNLQYLTWATRERIAVETSYAILEPAAQELQTYGASGIKASELANYLSTVSLGVIAVGGGK